MKYLLVIPAPSLAEPLAILAIKTEVNIVPGSSGWHATVMPPFEVVPNCPELKLKQALGAALQVVSRGSLELGLLRFHPEGTQETWVLSAGFKSRDEEWLTALSGRCHRAIEPLLTEPMTIYPPHLTFSKGWERGVGKLAYERLNPEYECRTFSFLVDELVLLGRESKTDKWNEIQRYGLATFAV